MKNYYFLWAFLTSVVNYCSSQKMSSATADTDQEQEIIKLSKEKWQWMAEQNVEKLDPPGSLHIYGKSFGLV